LTKRDEQVLRTVCRLRAAPTSVLQTAVFNAVSRQMGARTLRRLYDAQYLAVTAPRLDGTNIYGLAARGRAWCIDHGLQPRRVPRALPHHIALVTTWIGIAEVARQLSWHLRFMPSWELPPATAIPDALFEIAVPCPNGGHKLAGLLEVDCATEALGVVRQKIERLALLSSGKGLGSGFLTPSLAFALFHATPKRVEAVRVLIAEVWPGPAALWSGPKLPRQSLRGLYRTVVTDRCNGCNGEPPASVDHSVGCETKATGYSESKHPQR